ncbi:Uncharacterized conserved protein YgbK, DUF1537 family [Desulfovibrio litoralis DSM 11393]|uniref:Uncharacterized conserved protein YgbK, DUF1537 family n=2 Tax=Desulfovibrio litoralis TaxID=466107 RepID=A0A1M7TMK6_9BACT|nr:Uncharacterized conserved protein YgbK, DUF1537 family [Desulfovibrio litoralis DSM 11393]
MIIADDLTGANATGVLLARERFKAITLLNYNDKELIKNFEVIALTTNSRGLEPKEAYKKVADAVDFLSSEPVSFFNKRIDSTLRGNIGAEVNAMLDKLPKHIAVVVASFPSSQRVSIGGFLMVGDIPLEMTAIAKDPKNPINTSLVSEIVESQTKRKTAYISLQSVLRGRECVLKDLIEHVKNGAEIVIVDASTDHNIKTIAEACYQSQLKIVTVDPGPFTYYYAKEFIGHTESKQAGKKIIAAIGSVSNLGRRQVQELRLNYDVLVEKIDSESLLDLNTKDSEIERVVKTIIKDIDNYRMFVLVTTLEEDDVLNLKQKALELNSSVEEISQTINKSIAQITHAIIDQTFGKIGGVYTSGGDVTVAFCQEANAKGVEVKDNIIPLAVYGRLIKGKYDRLPIITKGGMIGDDLTLVKCMEYLLTKTSTE